MPEPPVAVGVRCVYDPLPLLPWVTVGLSVVVAPKQLVAAVFILVIEGPELAEFTIMVDAVAEQVLLASVTVTVNV